MTTTHPLPPLTVGHIGDADRIAELLLALLPAAGVLVVDGDLRIRVLEGRIYARHGMSARTAVGRRVCDVISARTWEVTQPLWELTLRDEATPTLDWTSPDGATAYRLHFAPLCTAEGEVVGATMVAQDVTEWVEAKKHLERQADRQTAVARIGSLALHGTPAAELLQEAARTVEATLGADVAAVLPYTADGGVEVRGSSGDTVGIPQPTGQAPDGPGQVLDVMREATDPLLIDDLRISPLRAPILEAEGMVSLAVAPVGPPANRYGLLGACSRTAGAFGPEDLVFLQAIANVLAGGIERERAAADARRREDKLNEAQRLAGMGSWEVDLITGAHEVSQHLQEMLGLDATATADEVFGCIHVDDRVRVQEHMAASARHAEVEAIEFRIVDRHEEVRVVRGEGTGERDGEGRTLALRGTVQDVTEMRRAEESIRRSEERFRKAFDMSPIGMTLIRPATGRYLRVNAAYCRLVGRTAEELLTMTFMQVAHAEDLQRPGNPEFSAGETDSLVAEQRYVRPDGSVVWASVNSTRVLGADGSVDVFFSQIEDVTERRAREDATRRELEQVAWVREIRAALDEDRFELFAQPIVDLTTSEVVQHELLIRMRTLTGELVPPGDFLPAAERFGAIRDIDRWVVSRGAELAARGMSVGINLSGRSIGDPTLIDEIDRALERTGADPSLMVFEITETALIENVETANRLAVRLRERGCRFALDDFGTGFSGLSSLKTLPLDYLKIDQEFIRDLWDNPSDRHLISAVVHLAGGFGMQTIAEGVEDEQTLDLLRELGVDHAQGYFLGRPAPLPPS